MSTKPRPRSGKHRWRPDNRVLLLENGDELFPHLLEAIHQAREEIFIETFILFDDEVGIELQKALAAAAERGVWVALTVDGYGSYHLPDSFILAMTRAGVLFRIFDPTPRWFGYRTNVFRRLHRKIAVIDGERAFIGGINFSRIHLIHSGPDAAQDYAVELQGSIVHDLRQFVWDSFFANDRSRSSRSRSSQAGSNRRYPFRHRKSADSDLLPDHSPPRNEGTDSALVRLVIRDNQDHRSDIEDAYLQAIKAARNEIIIANAYFFPGYRLLREIRNAAHRGVKVSLILQGEPDMPIAQKGARLLYAYLLEAGVDIYEYCERPLHSKVAIIDEQWATVGSSNLDPLSLSLNLEANVMILDVQFNRVLRERLTKLFVQCERIDQSWLPPRTVWRVMTSSVVFHFLRHFPAWAGWLPAHTPKLRPAAVADSDQTFGERIEKRA